MANNTANTSYGKPKVSGGIWRAPAGTELPTSATAALNESFVCLGYCSDDGVTNERGVEEEVKAWGGDMLFQTTTDTFKATFVEVLNVEVLKLIFGEENVTGTLETGITVRNRSANQEHAVYVIELMLRGALKRIVIPEGQVTDVSGVTYSDSDVVGYETTITAHEDESGVSHYEYIAKLA